MKKRIGCSVATLLVCGIALPAWADDQDDVLPALRGVAEALALRP